MSTTATTTLPNAYEVGLTAITGSRGMINGLIEGLHDDQLIAQPCKDGNHIIWQLGHLAYADDWFCSTLSGSASICDKKWSELFGMGSKPSGDAGKYPSLTEVREKFDKTRASLLNWFATLSTEQQAEPLSDELQGFAKTKVALMTALAGHEMMHAGQISVVRKALGLAPKYM